MAEPIRVCQIVDQLSTGGAEWLVATAAAEGPANSVEHVVVSLAADTDTPVAADLERRSVPVVTVASDRGQQMLDRERLGRLTAVLEEMRPDVVHLHLEMATIVGGEAARRLGIPTAVTLHGTVPHPGGHAWLKMRLLRRAIRRSDTVIAVGATVADVWRPRLGGVEPVVLVNPVPPRVAVRERPDRVPRIITVGRLAAAKSFPLLVEAMAEVHRQESAIDLYIVGEGPERADIEAAIERRGLADVVTLLGQRADVDDLLAEADIFVSSSSVEGMPLAILEAMAAGLPIVATSVGDIPGTVPADAGILVPPDRPDLLAGGLLELVGDPERRRRCGEAATRHVVEHHDPAVWGRKLAEIYRSTSIRSARIAS